MTLIELTVVVLVLLSLVTILMVGARAWKRGSDRAGCLMQIRQVQMSVRVYANVSGFVANEDVSPLNLKSEVIGPDAIVVIPPECPGDGIYSYGGNRIPSVGELYMTCSLAGADGHEPDSFEGW